MSFERLSAIILFDEKEKIQNDLDALNQENIPILSVADIIELQKIRKKGMEQRQVQFALQYYLADQPHILIPSIDFLSEGKTLLI